jgi:hypothetical protein
VADQLVETLARIARAIAERERAAVERRRRITVVEASKRKGGAA